MAELKSNLWKFNLYAIIAGFVLYYSFDKILMQMRGLSVTEIVLVEIVFALTAIIFEVPSGVLSDKWERRKVLALNSFFFMLNTFFWVIGQNVYFFLLGGMFAGIHVALISGTFTSLVYDTLKQLGNEEVYEKIWGNIASYEAATMVVAGVIGGMIAGRFGITIPFWLTFVFSTIAILIALSLKEPTVHRQSEETKYWEHIKTTFAYLWRHPTLYHLIVLMMMLLGTLGLMDEYMQLYFVKVGVPLFFLGYLGAFGNGIESVGMKLSYLLNRFQRKNVYGFFIIMSTAGFLLTATFQNIYGIIFPFLTLFASFTAVPLMLTDLHRELPSTHRATGESFVAFVERLFLVPIALGFSYLADNLSIFTAYFGVGLLLAFYLLVYFFWSYRFVPTTLAPSLKTVNDKVG